MTRRDHDTTRAHVRRAGLRPRPNEHPYLVAVAGEHAGRFFALRAVRELVIGRAPDCGLAILHDGNISRRHAQVIVSGDEVRIVDLGSTNGTLVNGRDVQDHVLQRGDRIFVGLSTILKFDFLSDDERSRWESATFDALTECYNRAFFDRRLGELVAAAEQVGDPFSLVMLDVDHFKEVNDTRGHQAGDFALQQVAQALQAELTRRGTVGSTCRYGGEEFGVLLPGQGAEEAFAVAEGLREAVAEIGLTFEGQPFQVTLSGGVATHAGGTGGPRGTDLVATADAALYRAKRAGRNRIHR
jgi:diguanylate cyclase (GGDEF)-like protein